MNDPKISQFNDRLKKIDKIHRRGGGFEAEGTLGQSYYTRKARRAARPVLRPMFALVAVVLVVKSISAASVPPQEYSERVDALRTGAAWQQASAFIMAPDPISQTVGSWLAPLISSQS